MHTDHRTDQLARIADLLQVDNPTTILDAWTRHRTDLRNPIAVLAGMPDHELLDQLGKHRPKPPPRPRCPTCDGTGTIANPDDPSRAALCPDCRGAKYMEETK